MTMHMRSLMFVSGIAVGTILAGSATIAFAAWVEPTASPPNNNAPTPLNIDSVNQQKSGGLYVMNLLQSNSLTVHGNGLLDGENRYFNFGTITGTSGYGFRDNNGTMQFKNSGGSWTNFNGSSSGGTTTNIAIPNCSSGQVLTATNGALACTTFDASPEGSWCGLATASGYQYLSYPYQTTPSRGNFKSIISCKGTSVAQSCPSGYSQQTICDTNGVDSGDAGSLQPFINTCFRTCIKGVAPTNPAFQFLQGLEGGQTQISPELQQWLKQLQGL